MYRVYRHAFLENVLQANECFQASPVLVIIVCVCVCLCVCLPYIPAVSLRTYFGPLEDHPRLQVRTATAGAELFFFLFPFSRRYVLNH